MLEKIGRVIVLIVIEFVGIRIVQQVLAERLISHGLWVAIGLYEPEGEGGEGDDDDLDIYRRAFDKD